MSDMQLFDYSLLGFCSVRRIKHVLHTLKVSVTRVIYLIVTINCNFIVNFLRAK